MLSISAASSSIGVHGDEGACRQTLPFKSALAWSCSISSGHKSGFRVFDSTPFTSLPSFGEVAKAQRSSCQTGGDGEQDKIDETQCHSDMHTMVGRYLKTVGGLKCST